MASIKDAFRYQVSTEYLDALDGAATSAQLIGGEFTNASRPDPSTVSRGTRIWNLDSNAPEYSDGTNWRDADGNIT